MSDFLFELGTEEIPARFVNVGIDYSRRSFVEGLNSLRLTYDQMDVLGSPRRLAVVVTGMAEAQPDFEETVVGPPAKIAFDDDGAPTKAALGFAKKNGASAADIIRGEADGKNGLYALLNRKEKGLPAREVLGPWLTKLLAQWQWPKAMRWAAREEAFVRPVRWLVATVDDTVLPVTFAGIMAGKQSFGHRFMSPEAVSVTPGNYVQVLREHKVMVDQKERRQAICDQLSQLDVQIRDDDELLDEVTNLVEWPHAVVGSFNEEFLEVPAEAIVSAMRSHQRYFACEGSSGLDNKFVTIAGTVVKDEAVTRKGNEKVLAARLSDAQFFFRTDKKTGLQKMNETLEGMLYHKQLGSVAAKVKRIKRLATMLAGKIGCAAEQAQRAAALCKADLASKMVYEFPDLQGVMGRYYATDAGEDDAVATAIEEHYLPKGSGSGTPQTTVGRIIAMADKIDLVVGGFAAGMKPTGSADPFGVRRAAIGLLIILEESGLAESPAVLVNESIASYEGTIAIAQDLRADVLAFLHQRLRGILCDRYRNDCVDAAMSAPWQALPDLVARVAAIDEMSRDDKFDALAAALKRVANITKDTADPGTPDPARFNESAEKTLWESQEALSSSVQAATQSGDYARALEQMSELQAPVDAFFEQVLVMDKDPEVRANRLALLCSVKALFGQIADFRLIAVE